MKISEINQSRSISLFMLLLVACCYWPLYQAEFINFDDFGYVLQNDYVREGFVAKSLRWAFFPSSFDLANWHPLTMISHMLDYQLFGTNAAGHHLMNVLFHAGNTLLVFLAFRMMTGTLWRSAAVAFLFGFHPLHVESVAWISERKDVLSTFFMFLSLITYVHYTKKQTAIAYLAAFLLYVLSLMSKPMTVTFPFLLLLLDYWPLQRFGGNHLNFFRERENRKILLRLIQEKIPFLVMSLIICIVTYIAQAQAGAVSPLHALSLSMRFSNSINSYLQYIIKMLIPYNLSIFYPLSGGIPLWQVSGAACFIVLVSCLVWRYRNRYPFSPVGWIWYLGSLVPVIGIVQVGMQSMADRYTYVPMIGLFMIFAWSLPDLTKLEKNKRIFACSFLLCLSVLIVFTTRIQASTWTNTMTVFSRAKEVTDRNILAMLQTAGQYAEMGKQNEAKKAFEELLALMPTNVTAHHNYGIFLVNIGNYEEGTKHLREALRLQPDSVTVHNSLARVMWLKGKTGEAEKLLNASLLLNPKNPDTHYYLALTTGNSKEKQEESIKQYREAIRIKPDYYRAHLGLSAGLLAQGKKEEAQKHFLLVMKENPYVVAENCFDVGRAMASKNNLNEAIAQYQEGLRISPGSVDERLFLASLYSRKGNIEDAMLQYKEVLRIKPDRTRAFVGMGGIMAGLGKTDEAVHYFKEALRLDSENAAAHQNLGLIAYKQGKMEEALSHYKAAIKADASDADARYYMGLVLEAKGESREAVRNLERALKIRPDFKKAKESLARLRNKPHDTINPSQQA